MGYDLGLGGCWPAGYYLVYSKIIIYIPIMYSTCLPSYLRAYLPTMYNSSLYWSLNYLRRSSNLLTYLLTYIHTSVTTYIPTYPCTSVPTYLYFLHTFFGIICVPMYSTCILHTCMHNAYVPIVQFIAIYLLLNYLYGSSNLLTYLLTYKHTHVTTYVPTYLYYLSTNNVPTYQNYLRAYLFTYLHTYLPYLSTYR